MKIIVLKGASNTGKTATLNRLILKLLQNGWDIAWFHGGKTKQIVIQKITDELNGVLSGKIKRPKERNIILSRQEADGKKYVGITTLGDQDHMITYAYELLLRHTPAPLDVFICASRPQKNDENKVLPVCYDIANGVLLKRYIDSILQEVIDLKNCSITVPASTVDVVNKQAQTNKKDYSASEMAAVDQMILLI